MTVAVSALLLWAAMIAIVDGVSRRIPNTLLCIAVVPGVLTLMVRDQGWLGATWLDSGLGVLLSLLILLPGFFLKALGGGDVKFAACCGGFLGAKDSLIMLLMAALMLGACSVWVLLRRRHDHPRSKRFPAGPAIALGFAGSMLMEAVAV